MEDLNALWIILAILILMLGPGGAVWVGMKGSVRRIEDRFTDFITQSKLDHEDHRSWLKDHEMKLDEHSTIIAVLKDRTERDEP